MNGRDGNGLSPRGGVLLTGATGFVGMEILARLIERTDRPIYPLVRADDDEAAERRIREVVRTLAGSEDACDDRVFAVRGDIEQPQLGLSEERRQLLAEQVSDVLHVAASVSFTLPLEEARAINVEGTRRVLELAELCEGLRRFSYVSTAYVAGTHKGDFCEHDVDVGQRFHNSYEQTKFEAERLVRSYGERMPIQVFRPSIIVGDSVTGWTSSFNVMYMPLKAFERYPSYAVPARKGAPVDVVPIDFVASAMVELVEHPDERQDTYHLVAADNATTIGRLMKSAARYFGRRRPPAVPTPIYKHLLHPLILRLVSDKQRAALRKTEVFFPYFSLRVRYDDRRTRRRLARAGISVTPVEKYFDTLVDFARRAKWGKVEMPRVTSQAMRASAEATRRHAPVG